MCLLFLLSNKSSSSILRNIPILNIKYRILLHYSSDIKYLLSFISPFFSRYLFDYQEPIPVENMVKVVCNYKQAYTQYGGLRPFGVAFLFAGWDKHHGFQLYQVSNLSIASRKTSLCLGIICSMQCFVSFFSNYLQSSTSQNHNLFKYFEIQILFYCH